MNLAQSTRRALLAFFGAALATGILSRPALGGQVHGAVLTPTNLGSKVRFAMRVSVHVPPVNINDFDLGTFEIAKNGKQRKVLVRVLNVAAATVSITVYARATANKVEAKLRVRVTGPGISASIADTEVAKSY